MSFQTCFKCGKILPVGGLKYIISIHILSDFEGVVLEPTEGVDEQIIGLVEELEKMDPETIEKDVHQKLTFHLCKRCKDEFAHDPVGSGGKAPFPKDKTSGMLH